MSSTPASPPGEPDPTLDATLAETAAHLRISTYRLARRLRAQRTDEIGVGQYSVLVSLSLHGPHTLGDLAEREHVTAPSMNRTVNCLVEAGLVERTPDADDRRRIRVALTEEGARLVDATDRRRDAWLEAELAALDPAERQTIAQATALIRRIAER
jgi:DNA-binding MarR family transcriptional regulator